MGCFAPCEYKKEVSQLRKRIAELDPIRTKEKIEKAGKSALRAINERDCARRETEKLKEIIIRLRSEIESLKDRLVWSEEDLLKAKEEEASARKAFKQRIAKLEKELSTAVWRLEKQQRDSEKALKKAMKQKEVECAAMLREMEEKYKKEMEEKEAVIRALTEQLNNSIGVSSEKNGEKKPMVCSPKTNSANSSTSPGQDPNHATIVNNRESSGLKPGGQKGHKPQPRKKMKPDKIILLPPPQIVLEHPEVYYEIGEKSRQVVSVRLIIEVTEYVGKCYRNHKTRKVVCSKFPDGVGHLEVNYDESVDAFAAFLHSVCNVPYNKIQELFLEATEGEKLEISTGKLAGLEKKFSVMSGKERADIWSTLFCSKVMNIDGTFARVNGKQRQVLVMRSADTFLYKMTGCKGEKALEGTPAQHYQGTIVCDGESTFTKLGKKRQGCLIHEGRYVRHAQEAAPELSWHKQMRELLKELQHRRKEDMGKGIMKMQEKERKDAEERYCSILRKGLSEYDELCGWLLRKQLLSNTKRLLPYAGEYSLDFESIKEKHAAETEAELASEVRKVLQKDMNTLIRLIADKENYLLFLSDYTIPPHNNDAEKAARTIKIHMKPNGGMRSDEYVGYYADTVSVLETERAQGRSRFQKMKEVFKRGEKVVAQKIKKAVENRKKKNDGERG